MQGTLDQEFVSCETDLLHGKRAFRCSDQVGQRQGGRRVTMFFDRRTLASFVLGKSALPGRWWEMCDMWNMRNGRELVLAVAFD